MKVVLLLMLWAGALGAADHGVAARFVPGEVRPGEVFELRVEMERGEYGRFSLKVPPHGSLHRVAVESVPVKLEGGAYRQRESWMLQADRAGEIVMENLVVVMTDDDGETEHVLPPLRMEVLPWGAVDESVAPVGFPEEVPTVEEGRVRWWWLLPLVGAIGLMVWWPCRPAKVATGVDPDGGASLEEALDDLENGCLRSLSLEQLLIRQGAEWSVALREMVEQAVYAGRGDAGAVAAMLRKEVGA